MTAADHRAILLELRGKVCACGAQKQAKHTFCRSHYYRLPSGTRERIYQTGPEYFAAYEEACTFLRLPLAGAPRPRQPDLFPQSAKPQSPHS